MSIKALWQITAVLIAIILMVIFPIMNSFEQQDRLLRIQMIDKLDYFVSKIKQTGSISPRDYEIFSDELSNLGLPFEIEIRHYKQIYVPVYENPNDFSSFQGKIQRTEELFSDAEIKECLFPIDSPELSKPYKMAKGDYLDVTIKGKVRSKYQKIKNIFLGTNTVRPFYAKLGGMIQNEAY